MIDEIILDMINYNQQDTKRINHALKVHSYSRIIGKKENLSSDALVVLEIAAVLHDIGIKVCERKYNSTNGFLQQIEGPIVADAVLDNYEINDEMRQRILFLIAHHHTFKNVDDIDHQILLEADLIVNAQEEYITKYAFWNAVDKLFVTQSGKEIACCAVKEL